MEKELIVCVITNSDEYHLQEYKELLSACDLEIIQTFSQDVKVVDFRTYIGSGKVNEVADYISTHACIGVYFHINLTPLQVRNLEEIYQIPVIDREELILEIFNRRAVTKVAHMQIELARLKKILPRLVGAHTQLSRQSGGKNKGTGEKQLELDRRRIKARINELRKDLQQVEKERMTQRKQRMKAKIPIVAFVGYTNAGKSTLMNALMNLTGVQEDKLVFEKNMLFATLDTATRRISLPSHQDFIITDTVGFVSELPHNLIDAFHSTLEEIVYADLLIQVIDASDYHRDMHQQVTMQTLQDLKAGHIPMITLFNKCDQSTYPYPQVFDDQIYISALQPEGVQLLLDQILTHLYADLKSYRFKIPYDQLSLYSTLMDRYPIQQVHEEEDAIYCVIQMTTQEASKYHALIIDTQKKDL